MLLIQTGTEIEPAAGQQLLEEFWRSEGGMPAERDVDAEVLRSPDPSPPLPFQNFVRSTSLPTLPFLV